MKSEGKRKANATPASYLSEAQLHKLSLVQIADLLKQESDAGEALTRKALAVANRALLHFINVGGLLTTAKTKLEHGEFQTWIERHYHRSMRSVERHMRLYKNREVIIELLKVAPDEYADQLVTEKHALALLEEHERRIEEAKAQAEAFANPPKHPGPPHGHEKPSESSRENRVASARKLLESYDKRITKLIDGLFGWLNELGPRDFAEIALGGLEALVRTVKEQLAEQPAVEVTRADDLDMGFERSKPVDNEHLH